MAKTKKKMKTVGGSKKVAKKATKKTAAKKQPASKKTSKKAKGTEQKNKTSKKTVANSKATKSKDAKTKAGKTKASKVKPTKVKASKTPAKASSKKEPKGSDLAKSKKQSSKSSVKSTGTQSYAKMEGLFTPLDDRLIVILEGVSEITSGGIIIPGSAETERPNRGEVIAVGRGHLNTKGKVKPLDVRAGDKILFGPYSGTQVRIGKMETIILRESEVLGILEA